MAETCTVVAVIGDDRYPCRGHNFVSGSHYFAMHWPPCPAPFCKLPPHHAGLHDIPSGYAQYEVGSPKDGAS